MREPLPSKQVQAFLSMALTPSTPALNGGAGNSVLSRSPREAVQGAQRLSLGQLRTLTSIRPGEESSLVFLRPGTKRGPCEA